MNLASSGSGVLARRVTVVVFVLVWVSVPVGSAAQESGEPTLRKIGRVAHPPIGEVSGIVRSRRYEDVWWVHNDSGNPPQLFAIDDSGAVHMRSFLRRRYAVGPSADTSGKPVYPGVRLGAAAHVDYEDIALDDSTLYLGDIGNNFNSRRDLGIYVIPEPHFHAQRTRPSTYIRIAYPNQDHFPAEEFHFDAESLLVLDGRLHLLTKRWQREDGEVVGFERGTTLYRLDTEYPHQVNELTRVDRHDTIPAPTAAAPNPSGDRIAVLSYASLWIFPRPDDGTHWLSTEPRKIELSGERLQQAEAVTWDSPSELRITNEQRDVFVLAL